MISRRRAQALGPALERLLQPERARERIPFDPVQFPRRYSRPEDAEVAALVASCFAYGKAEVFIAKLEPVFAGLGDSPSRWVRQRRWRERPEWLGRFAYRFHKAPDLAALLSAVGSLQRDHGTLDAAFARARIPGDGLQADLARFVASLRGAVDPAVRSGFGEPEQFDHLLPDPAKGGASKRLLLFLRWMVRGGPADPVDLGIWRSASPRELIVPLDTHISRAARRLRLTRRTDHSFRTAEEITASLRLVDPADPVKYDFALCHLGMSGACSRSADPASCGGCALAAACAEAAARPAD